MIYYKTTVMKNVALILFLFGLVLSNAYAQNNRDYNHPDIDFREFFSKPESKPPKYEKYKDRNKSHKLDEYNHKIPKKTNLGHVPLECQIEIVKDVLADDFQINDDTTGGCEQSYPSIAMDHAGNFVIVWSDYRNGNSDIYFQRYNSNGSALGENIKVNDDIGISLQLFPSIAIDHNGNFVIVWYDERNGNDVYFQRYNSDGIAQSVNTKTNNKDIGGEMPSIAIDDNGNFVIAWKGYNNNNYDIYFQRYKYNGIAIQGNKKVNDDIGNENQTNPTIAMNENGDFVIAWMDYRNSNWDVYFQKYYNIGTTLGVNKKTNDDVGSAVQSSPSLAIEDNGNFVIAWEDDRDGNEYIYFQSFNSHGIAIGSNTKGESGRKPSISIDKSGNFVIVCSDFGKKSSDIYFQMYLKNGITSGGNIKVNDDTDDAFQDYPEITMDINGNFVILFIDSRNLNYDIYYQQFNKNGAIKGINTKVNDDSLGSDNQYYPSIAIDSSNNSIIVWKNHRFWSEDVYFQILNKSVQKQGLNKKVNDDIYTDLNDNPTVSMNRMSNCVIVWRDGDRDVYFQHYKGMILPQGGNIKVNKSIGFADCSSPSSAIDENDDFIITWNENRNGNSDIYYQRFDSNRNPQGINEKVNDDTGKANQYNPEIAIDKSGNFIIVWEDYRNNQYSDVYFQIYDKTGTIQGLNTKVNDEIGSVNQLKPQIVIFKTGDFLIIWQDYRNGNSDIYYQLYNRYGVAQGVNVKVNNDIGSSDQVAPKIAMEDNGNFVIVWQDYRYGIKNPDIIGQRYFADGSPNGGNYRIVADGPNHGETFPSVAVNGDKIVFTWMDNRRSKGWDIYAKVVGWDWDGVTSIAENESTKSKDFELIGNYPNPFSDNTIFEYLLGNKSDIDVSVFDIHGKKIRTLQNGMQIQGRHNLSWDGKNFNGIEINNGIYFIRFTSSKFQIIVKTLLLR